MKDRTWMIMPGFALLGLLGIGLLIVTAVNAEEQAASKGVIITHDQVEEPKLHTDIQPDTLFLPGKCSIDKDGHLKLQEGVTQDACLKYVMIAMLNAMKDSGDRCDDEKRMILDAWDKSLHPALPNRKNGAIRQ